MRTMQMRALLSCLVLVLVLSGCSGRTRPVSDGGGSDPFPTVVPPPQAGQGSAHDRGPGDAPDTNAAHHTDMQLPSASGNATSLTQHILPEGLTPPQVPADLCAGAPTAKQDTSHDARPVPYEVTFSIADDAGASSVSTEERSALLDAVRGVSLLERLADQAPDSVTGVERRLRSDEDEARNVLHSRGFYAGRVEGRLDAASSPLRVTLTLFPGPLYTVADSRVVYRAGAGHSEVADDKAGMTGVVGMVGPADAPDQTSASDQTSATGQAADSAGAGDDVPSPSFAHGTPEEGGMKGRPAGIAVPTADADSAPVPEGFPRALSDAGVAGGAPARADDILDAVARIPVFLHERGHPFAVVTGTRFEVDHAAHTLHATVTVDPGPYVLMGGLDVEGADDVSRDYVATYVGWRPGQPWDERLVERFRESLRGTGLFSGMEVVPADHDDATGCRPVMARLTYGPPRSFGGGLRYDSALGPGVLAFWEHRNLWGGGERLRLELPVWERRQEVVASFRKPFLLRPDQDFIADAWARNENSDAYDQRAGAVSASVERRISRHLWASAGGTTEGGSINDHQGPERSYSMWGVPLTIRYDGTDNLLDPHEGVRAALSTTPYTGVYHEWRSMVRSRLDASAYTALPGGRTVLALRAAAGALHGESPADIPASFRFYSGGGGSVRGYAYQSLGPRDGDVPLGGGSFGEVGLEARTRITETLGLVTFVDGGNVYEESMPRFGDGMRFGAGVGLRYYTAIGPLRFDVATPVNPREDDAPLQFYFSIGQSF
ncbi:outer membrane protein, OMP85 family [Nitratidesulfovibrio vulgaris str. Hildenborough]|uniref:Outer membrane protein, OMP85 family n=2 Tax=Nitratidesulfovibrio vulgaris TaxID=881 RepID=Q72A95_NITV2|nr:outer membrane protein, OMP85 family [Nitratidesulfovibrio vulgaris str. Hildenborough]ADP87101.1 surface antigen (D15) [Nitratidesulfovibrio vulgaris RCH1]